MLPDALIIAWHFANTRWRLNFYRREKLETWQQQQLNQFIKKVLPLAPRYKGSSYARLADIPIMNKALMMRDFDAGNTRGVLLNNAMEIALRAEESRDFSPTLGDLTVGLSSGTSGNRGVFLVSETERKRWAGILLARAIPPHLFARLLSPWKPALRIAFFLRANSNLYTTLNSSRIDFSFYDLLLGVAPSIQKLNETKPDILVGPPSLLRALTMEARAGRLQISPSHVISVAEVLEQQDKNDIIEVFGCKPHQLYQATEGFLAYTCEAGTLHLNETFVHIEKEWLDSSHTRFQPVITDFTRETQLIVRYRLNDILRIAKRPCSCGRAELAIDAIEGRADDVLWFPALKENRAVAIFPDLIRRAMLLAGTSIHEYSISQSGMHLKIGLLAEGDKQYSEVQIASELEKVWQSTAIRPPKLHFEQWKPLAAGVKRRRVRLDSAPEGLKCTF